MTAKIGIYYLLSFLLSLNTVLGFTQNLGSYSIPSLNRQLPCNQLNFSEETLPVFMEQVIPEKDYPNLSIQLISKNESLGAEHFTYQLYSKDHAIEQALLKIHVQKHSGKVILIQTNLPEKQVWKALLFDEGDHEVDLVYLLIENQLKLAKKRLILEESKDYYAERFEFSTSHYFENELKYHNDTIAYANVFNPDPLTSANQVYGGLYQDAFTKDTSGILIQNINNPGGSTVTVNGTSFTFDGQTFNVPTESYLNSFTAPILNQVFENIFLDGQGSILGFNTVLTDNISGFTTQIIREDYNYPTLADEQVWKSIPADFSGGVFNLSNDFFIISEFSSPFTNPASSVSDSFNFDRSELGFEDVNAFYHLNNYRSYWLSLGFTGLDSEVILIDAHGNNGADNSFFSPTSPPRLVFGQGGVDDAEDADVVIHEYGHALSNFASPNSNSGSERRALDEGFGDYLATSYSRQFSTFNSSSVFSWDGHNEFWLGRISNSNKTKLDVDINQNIYYNGEIWSATLMDLYEEIGAINTDKLAIEVMYYNMPNSTISDAAMNLFIADTSIFNGVHTCQIFDVLFARQFLKGTCTDFYSGIRGNNQGDDGVHLLNSDGFTNRNEALILEIENYNGKEAQLVFVNLEGKIVEEIDIKEQLTALDVPNLAKGTYFIELSTEDGTYQFKVLKK